jgi:hypothetical protein
MHNFIPHIMFFVFSKCWLGIYIFFIASRVLLVMHVVCWHPSFSNILISGWLKWTNSNVAKSSIFDGLLFLKKCLKKFQIWQSSIVQINLSITSLRLIPKFQPFFDNQCFHVIKALIILIASFVRGYIMMLKLHEWSQEIWSKNVIFKCKNYVLHLLFHVQIVVVVKNKVRSKKCLKKFQIWQSSIVQINLSITSLRLIPSKGMSFRFLIK